MGDPGMRRRDRQLTGREELETVLRSCRVCRLAMVEGGVPYVVPLNFGYRWGEEGLTLCFHSAGEGRKLDGLRQTPLVAFEMDCEHALDPGREPWKCTWRYASLMGLGRPVFCRTPAEKTAALNVLMTHQTGRGDYEYPPALLERTAVFRLEVTELTGKRNP